ncbi:ATP-dependent RNA helicase DBP9 [Histoplasma capsulatum var. duboisii H88]|uniref:ATP-dependent RNA helicase DBP9 n=1 Tax=Ajellomyces capsulatus (strain H88) TaxID=544711 RepID=A0A8A1LXD9_AJEC8|nr:ATP-dependent RNA helicase DBP9 [Histoplasma capsulatum var. duboisii H88]
MTALSRQIITTNTLAKTMPKLSQANVPKSPQRKRTTGFPVVLISKTSPAFSTSISLPPRNPTHIASAAQAVRERVGWPSPLSSPRINSANINQPASLPPSTTRQC